MRQQTRMTDRARFGAALLGFAVIASTGCGRRLDANPAAVRHHAAAAPLSAQELRDLHARARTFAEFVGGMQERRTEWERRLADCGPMDSARALLPEHRDRWHVLVVAEEGCVDSRNNMPLLTRLLDAAPRVDVRFLNSTEGKAILRTHHSPDGREAIPTVVVLDDQYREIGCWVERPKPIERWFLAHQKEFAGPVLHDSIEAWYARDQGATASGEFVTLFVRAAKGQGTCRSASDSALPPERSTP